MLMLAALGAMRGGSLRTPPRSSARAARSRPLVMKRAKTGAWVENEGSLDWLMTAMRRQACELVTLRAGRLHSAPVRLFRGLQRTVQGVSALTHVTPDLTFACPGATRPSE